MRILVATPYLRPEGGGLERYAGTIAEELSRLGHDVTHVGHGQAQGRGHGGGSVREIAVPPALKLSNTPIAPAFSRAVRALLREERFDVVHGHAPVPGAAEMAWWAARREGVPFVLTYHAGKLAAGTSLFALPAALHRRTVERAMIRGAACRIAVSRFVADGVFGGLRAALVPPGVDAERFSPGGAPVPGRVLYVGPVSRAYAWKGLATLHEAVERVPGATLRVVGDGDLAERLRNEGVDVVGRVDDDRLVREYRAASVVALPSLTAAESFGMVLAEANACGRPVVGSRVGGIPCFVREGENGALAAPGDVDDLARALRHVLDHPDEAARMGRRGRARVERDHRWHDLAVATERVLTAASGRGSRRSGASGRATPRAA